MNDVCERCGEESDYLNDNLVCFNCLLDDADQAMDRMKEDFYE